MPNGGAVLAYRDQTVVRPRNSEGFGFVLLALLEVFQGARQLGGKRQFPNATARLRQPLDKDDNVVGSTKTQLVRPWRQCR